MEFGAWPEEIVWKLNLSLNDQVPWELSILYNAPVPLGTRRYAGEQDTTIRKDIGLPKRSKWETGLGMEFGKAGYGVTVLAFGSK